MVDISQDEIDNFIINVRKEIKETVIDWEFKDGVFKFRVNVENEENIPLKLIGTYNHRNGNFSFTLLLKDKRIRGLDCGKTKVHHNRDCTMIRGKHKHKWTDDSGDKYAYKPEDIDCNDLHKAFEGFLRECNITFRGTLRKPFMQSEITRYSSD